MKRIVATAAILGAALIGYKYFHLDGGQITLLIVGLGALLAGYWYYHKKYGTRRMLGMVANKAIELYNPDLPPLMDEGEETFPYPGFPSPSPLPGAYGQPYAPVSPQRHADSSANRSAVQTAHQPMLPMGPGGHVHVQEVTNPAMPPMAGYPPALGQPPYVPLPEFTQYDIVLGPQAVIDVDQIFRNILLLDTTGNLVRVLAEELAAKGTPLLFVDVTGAYTSLLSEFQVGWRVCSPASLQPGTVDPRAIPLDRDSAEDAMHVGRTILHEGGQVLFQFSSYLSPIDAVITLWDIIKGMREWEQTQLRRAEQLVPGMIFLTEAYRFTPNDNSQSIFRENSDVAQSVRGKVFQALKAKATDGLYWCLESKKGTGIEPHIVKQCDLWMIHRPPVTDVRSKWITSYTGVGPHELEMLPSKQAMIVDRGEDHTPPQVITFRESRSGVDDMAGSSFSFREIAERPTTSGQERMRMDPFLRR